MSDDALILGLRMGVVGLLYVFLLALVVLTQRELHRESRTRAAIPREARLVIIHPGSGSHSAGQVIPLAPVTRFGRADDNTVILDDEFVSSAHALVLLRNGRWWVRDEGSTNGTVVNGSQIRDETILNDGDELQIGSVRMRLAQ